MDKVKIGKVFFKILLGLLAVVIAAVVLLISFLLLGPRIVSYINSSSFQSEQWKQSLATRDPIKLHMIDDLMSKRQLVGMSQAEIDQLLGKPPKTNYFKEYDYVYWLGPERSAFGIDSEWVGIKFHDGKVVEVKVLRD